MKVEWLKNKLKEKFYPITHSKAVLFGENNSTVYDELTEINSNLAELKITSKVYVKVGSKVSYPSGYSAHTLDVSSVVPDGYRAAIIVNQRINANNIQITNFYFSNSNNEISYAVTNYKTTAIEATPTFWFTVVKA